MEEETKSYKEVREVNKISIYARVVKKPQSSGARLTKNIIVEAERSSRDRVRRNHKSETNEALKFGKIEGTYEVVPLMTLQESIDEILRDGNLRISMITTRGL